MTHLAYLDTFLYLVRCGSFEMLLLVVVCPTPPRTSSPAEKLIIKSTLSTLSCTKRLKSSTVIFLQAWKAAIFDTTPTYIKNQINRPIIGPLTIELDRKGETEQGRRSKEKQKKTLKRCNLSERPR